MSKKVSPLVNGGMKSLYRSYLASSIFSLIPLAFADPAKLYVLHVDTSLNGLGAVLYQEYPEGLRPVAFVSQKLSISEHCYPIHPSSPAPN